MRKGIIFVLSVVTVLMLLSQQLFAKRDSGLNLILLGDSAISLGRGGTGVSSQGVDLFYLNPASIAFSERLGFGIQFGTLDFGFYNPNISVALPTSYGVIGTSLRVMDIPSDRNDIKNGYLLSIGGAKDFTDRLMMGAALNLFNGSDASDKLYYTGISIGSIYRLNYGKRFQKGFGILNPRIGISLNAGIPTGENDDYSNFNQLTFGYNFLFYSKGKMDIAFFNDFSAIHKYDHFPAKFGFETTYKKRYIGRVGFILPQSYEYGDSTIGLGYRFKEGMIEGDINYSLVHYSGSDFVHYMGLNMKYGRLDRKPPDTKIEASEEYISPNYDGRQDFVFFNLEVDDRSRIKGWRLQIINAEEEVVREYKISERDIEEDLGFKDFIRKIWQRKESMVVPETILWDGTDSRRRNVPDGRYKYSFIAWDERDNIAESKDGIIYVDNTPPEVKIKTEYLLFSPNGDDQKDTIKIGLDVTTSIDDEWRAGFTDSGGNIIRSFQWVGDQFPDSVVWDGRDNIGVEAKEGLYSFFIESNDRAGNRVEKFKREISLTRKYEVADLTTSMEYFSYNMNNDISFYPYISQTEGLQEWSIIITDKDQNEMRRIDGKIDFPKFIKWDGRNRNGKRLKDGRYSYKISTRFNSGNRPASFQKEIIIDSTPPRVSLDYSPSLFSPDEDGNNDILTIFPEAKDQFGITEWSLDIYASSGSKFRTFKGKSELAGEIKWDGVGKSNMLVESAADYYLQLTATDLARNISKTERIRLPIDVLVVVTERGFKIMISNIEFKFDSANLTGRAFPILNRVAEILDKYSRYNIMIEGHTCDIGEEKYNLKLSEDRANSVRGYLISKGIDEDRLTFRGMGETAPFLPNTTSENQRRNRRVEFLLLKKK
ncbi:MAG: OmpA family protein [Spirochaetota bacterium]|nr:OmpA family protein [Spirochaetota bacterium]